LQTHERLTPRNRGTRRRKKWEEEEEKEGRGRTAGNGLHFENTPSVCISQQ